MSSDSRRLATRPSAASCRAPRSSTGIKPLLGGRVAEWRTTRPLAELVHGDVEQPGQAEVPLLQLGPALLLGRGRRVRWGRARWGAVQLGEAVQPAVVVVPIP